MPTLADLRQALHITRSSGIARRYFVTNGFDGALAMLGLLMGFRTAGSADVRVALAACLGTAIALGSSGIASAYISEAAERRRGLAELQDAMLKELGDSAHGRAARWAPLLIALVNGTAPFVIALLIMSPLWFSNVGKFAGLPPYDAAIAIAFTLIFLLGTFLGRVGGYHWLAAGLRTTAIGLVTAAIIVLVGPA